MRKHCDVIKIIAGEKVELFNRKFSSIPMSYQFNAEPLEGGKVSGVIEIETRQVVFAKPTRIIDLQKKNVIEATIWDTFVKVSVMADIDMNLSIPIKNMPYKKTFFVVAVLLVLMALAMMAPHAFSDNH